MGTVATGMFMLWIPSHVQTTSHFWNWAILAISYGLVILHKLGMPCRFATGFPGGLSRDESRLLKCISRKAFEIEVETGTGGTGGTGAGKARGHRLGLLGWIVLNSQDLLLWSLEHMDKMSVRILDAAERPTMAAFNRPAQIEYFHGWAEIASG